MTFAAREPCCSLTNRIHGEHALQCVHVGRMCGPILAPRHFNRRLNLARVFQPNHWYFSYAFYNASCSCFATARLTMVRKVGHIVGKRKFQPDCCSLSNCSVSDIVPCVSLCVDSFCIRKILRGALPSSRVGVEKGCVFYRSMLFGFAFHVCEAMGQVRPSWWFVSATVAAAHFCLAT